MKRLIFLILALIMFLTLGITAFADDSISDKVKLATPMADELNKLGVFKGSDKGYELERPITRAETMAIIVRIIGKEYEASCYVKNHDFTDVPEWANKYVAFARDNGITNGVSETTFGASNYITARQFLTLLFRALGYSEHFDDCSYETIFQFAQDKGLIMEGEYSDKTNFVRADVVILITKAFEQTYRFSECKVIDILTSPRVPETGFVNTRGEGIWMAAGTISERPGFAPLPVVDKSLSYEENRGKLNEFLMDAHFCAIWPQGIYTGNRTFYGAGLIQDEDGRYGLNIFSWRKEYNTMSNTIVNAILETMYFLSGDKEVAYALWSWFDSKNINGFSNTDYFGFKDLEVTDNGFIITKNGIEIEFIKGNKEATIYFK